MAKILIVEDEIIVAWDIKETLEKLGHTIVDLVVSGAEALGSAINDRPDLVLMDIRLEGDIDGIAAGDEIYHQLKIPVVYLTAHADELTLARATKTDPFGYIIKPFQSQSLQSTIKVALQRHQLEIAADRNQTYLVNTLNSIGNGIITTDRQGLVTFINPIAEVLTGWHSVDAIGVEIDRVFHLTWEIGGTAIENPSLRAMCLRQPIKSPARSWLVPKNAPEILITDLATPIFTTDGEIVGSIIVFQDNTERLTAEMDLWDRNQDLEFFQLKLISQLQAKTAEQQQAISCIQVLNLALTNFQTAATKDELLQIVIEKLGTTLDADYCWITLHDRQGATSRVISEYINPERQIYPTSKIGKEIDLLLYPQFYNHLFEIGNWIDPPLDILPKPYLDLLNISAQMLICPIIIDSPIDPDQFAQRQDSGGKKLRQRTIGEFGIITTGKPHWTPCQSRLITQTLSYTVQLSRQTDLTLFSTATPRENPQSTILSLEWLNSLQEKFSNSIADVHRDMSISAQMLQRQIDSIDPEPESFAVTRHHQFLHHELAINLDILQEEWRRQFQLIDISIDVLNNGITFQIQSLNDVLFRKWIATIIKNCSSLAERYQQDFSYQINEQIPQIMLCPFPLLELIILEMFNNACKYTLPYYPILLEVEIQDHQLQLNVVSFEIEIPARELETMFIPFIHNSLDSSAMNEAEAAAQNQHLSLQHGSTGLGLALVKKLVMHLGGSIQAISDRHSTRLILVLPVLGGDLQN